MALSRLLKAPFWLLASDQLLRTRYKTEAADPEEEPPSAAVTLEARSASLPDRICSQTSDGQSVPSHRTSGIDQRLILISQPENSLFSIPPADVRTQFHEGIVNGSSHYVGMIQITGALNGDSPLVIVIAGSIPGAILLLHSGRI